MSDRHEKCDQCDKGYSMRSHQDETPTRNACDEWNAKHPPGTPVMYEEVIGLTGPFPTATRSEAWFCGYNAVAKIEGKSGGCAISHMTVIPAQDHAGGPGKTHWHGDDCKVKA